MKRPDIPLPEICLGIVPPGLVRRLAEQAAGERGQRLAAGLALDAALRAQRGGAVGVQPLLPGPRLAAAAPQRTISDADHGTTLPGAAVRIEGSEPSGDPAVDEAYDGLGSTWTLFQQQFGRDSLDDAGLPLEATVHYGQDYANAFWDGQRMVFGDGDGVYFRRLTLAVEVIGHELTHGVIQLAGGLTYQGQSGALNESLADVFGSQVKQRALGQDADQADWLIGAGLFTPKVQGVALRSMKAPGTAYDDPALGRDDQPATMADYLDTEDDHGGVHTNSGIPNHAFYRTATALGGPAWVEAGQIWYDVLTGGLPSDVSFAGFARSTVQAAKERFGAKSRAADAVADAWREVGVSTRARRRPPVADPEDPARQVYRLHRTGGLAGSEIERTIAVTEAGLAPWQHAMSAVVAADSTATVPDRYLYRLTEPTGQSSQASEENLPPDIREFLDQACRPER